MKARLPDKLEAPPRRRWSTRWVMAAACVAGLVLVAGVCIWFDTRAEFWTKAGVGPAGLPGAESKKGNLLGSAALAPNDPVLRFSETKVGQIVFSTTSDICRRHLFDNRTGRTYWVDALPCAQSAELAAGEESSARLIALKKAFQR